MMTGAPDMALVAEDTASRQRMELLAGKLGLPLVGPQQSGYSRLLVQTTQRLELRQTGKNTPGPVFADFVSGKAAYRRRQGIGRKQPIARAVGIKRDYLPRIIDATAGLGQDALVLATLGCRVTLVERSPVVAALLADALQRALSDGDTVDIAQRMQLIEADACKYLVQLAGEQRPDVVYLDPMFPQRQKSASVKKEMALFQHLPGTHDNADALLPAALQAARQRVVVKRPAKAPWLANHKPDLCVNSTRMRFDVYLQNSCSP